MNWVLLHLVMGLLSGSGGAAAHDITAAAAPSPANRHVADGVVPGGDSAPASLPEEVRRGGLPLSEQAKCEERISLRECCGRAPKGMLLASERVCPLASCRPARRLASATGGASVEGRTSRQAVLCEWLI